jgi:hypothetical protein
MKILFLILTLCSITVAQSSRDLQKKFGTPTSETFRVRPTVNMTVTYGKTGTACTLALEPVYQWIGAHRLDEADTFIKMSLVEELFDDLAPKSERGVLISGPREAHVEWVYQNVVLATDGTMENARHAVIAFKNARCK